MAEAYIDLTRRHQVTVGGMNEDCLVLLYVGLSCEAIKEDRSPLTSTPGLFTEMAMYPGLKIHPVVNAAASRLFLISILAVKRMDLEKPSCAVERSVYREISDYLCKQLASLDRTRDACAALDLVTFLHLLTWGKGAHHAPPSAFSDSEWVGGLMAIASWPRERSSERLQIVCLNAAKNILGAAAPDRFSEEELQAFVGRLFDRIHGLLWGGLGTGSLARAVDPEFRVESAVNCAFKAKDVVSRGDGGVETEERQRKGFCWASHTVNCARGGCDAVEWKVTLLAGCDAFVGLSSGSALCRSADPIETEAEDVWLYSAASGKLHSQQFFSRRMDGCSEGDVLTLSVDCDRAALSISKNGERSRVAFAGLPRDADLHPMFVLSGGTTVRVSEVVEYVQQSESRHASQREDTGPTETEVSAFR